MLWVLILALVAFTLITLGAVLVLADVIAEMREQEGIRVEVEMRRAERRIHNVASNAFQAMLDAARAHDPRAVK